MRVLIAPNAFKGCLTAAQAARAMARGVRREAPDAEIDLMPVSDGGDGLMEVLLARLGGRRIERVVTGPLGRPRRARYGLLAGGAPRTAVIEMAQASGIAGLGRGQLDPLGATSRGTGELIADALRRGAKRLIVGLGGSATNDGGAGLAQALGARLVDADGAELPPGAASLARLARADASALAPRLRGVSVVAVSDVRNPLLGPRGSARVYGPQKGATPAMVRALEAALSRYARVLRRDLGRDVARLPGAGAAGGLGAGLAAFLGAELVPGAGWVLARLGARGRVARAGFVLTGEGRLDEQSFYGKAPVALARLAREARVPVRLLCGQVRSSARAGLKPFGRGAGVSLSRPGEAPAASMRDCRGRLERAAAESLRRAVAAGLLALLALVARPAGAASPSTPTALSTGAFAEADALYYSRNEAGHLERAAELLRELLTREEDPRALWRLGRCLVRQGERAAGKKEKLRFFLEAERVSARAVELDPRSADAHFGLGLAYGRRGETQGMMKSLFLVGPIRREMEAALSLEPSHPGAHHVLGEMLRRLPRLAGGSKREALAHLEKSAALAPERTAIYADLARAYLDAGKPEKAREALERLLAVKTPEDPAEHPEHVAEAKRLLGTLGR